MRNKLLFFIFFALFGCKESGYTADDLTGDQVMYYFKFDKLNENDEWLQSRLENLKGDQIKVRIARGVTGKSCEVTCIVSLKNVASEIDLIEQNKAVLDSLKYKSEYTFKIFFAENYDFLE